MFIEYNLKLLVLAIMHANKIRLCGTREEEEKCMKKENKAISIARNVWE
jgi:hypothetical protein